ncbi:hypothetical protein [Paenibacillus thermotolerans]|uniref:hypothetical protein n=1 Tax=Paenibacillus thermotolerans TaxID=3027807 RepID=UPI0023679A41|nr:MULTISPECIES: hypothetical protein [unclassified Paenibacillus]
MKGRDFYEDQEQGTAAEEMQRLHVGQLDWDQTVLLKTEVRKDDGLGFFRGLVNAFLLSVMFWSLVGIFLHFR